MDTAAILTIGSELTLGLRVDTNTREIAIALASAGYQTIEAISLADDIEIVAATLKRLTSEHAMVIVTGGLGPTHDDITREAAATALDLPMRRNAGIEAGLHAVIARHRTHVAAEQVLEQADVIESAEVIPATSGTAPGQVVPTPAGRLALLPGPPHEMRPMLEHVLGSRGRKTSATLRCVMISESDAQVRAQKSSKCSPFGGM